MLALLCLLPDVDHLGVLNFDPREEGRLARHVGRDEAQLEDVARADNEGLGALHRDRQVGHTDVVRAAP